MVTSPYAHAEIVSINKSEALRVPGVQAVIAGDYYQVRCGPVIVNSSIAPGHTSPTQVKLTSGSVGSLSKCIIKLKDLINWDEGQRIEIGYNKVRAKGWL